MVNDDSGDGRTEKRLGYPIGAWILGALTLFPLVPMLIGQMIPGTRRYLGCLGVSLSSVGLLVALVVVIEVAASTGGGGETDTEQAERPAPVAKSAEILIQANIQAMAVATIKENSGVVDAAINQDGKTVSLVIIVGYATNERWAKEVGENFVRLVKSLSQDSQPGKMIGRGMYDYLIGVYYPDQERMALGAKARNADRISW